MTDRPSWAEEMAEAIAALRTDVRWLKTALIVVGCAAGVPGLAQLA